MMEGRGVLRSPAAGSGSVPAVSVSTLLAPLFDIPGRSRRGAVLSVHGSAVNLVVDGALVTIASDRAGGLPNGLLVAEPFSPRAAGVRAGMAARISQGELAIEDVPLRITTRDARHWRPELRPMPVPSDLLIRIAIATRAVRAAHAVGNRGIVSVTEASEMLAAAFSSSGSVSDIAEAGRRLVGLGAGLTPSGDDVLVGVTAALTALGDGRARPFARMWARHARGRTTVVAEAFHRHAAAGAYSERLHDVLRAIVTGPVAAIPAAVRTAAAWGATSGTDTLAGILMALDLPRAGAERDAA